MKADVSVLLEHIDFLTKSCNLPAEAECPIPRLGFLSFFTDRVTKESLSQVETLFPNDFPQIEIPC